jgi:glycosyltransferase involved in cell wall biosynthesis
MTQLLGRSLVRAGHGVRVIGVYPPGLAAPMYQEDEGVQVWRIPEPTGRLGWVRARYELYRTVAAWAREGRIDLVEVPDWEGWAAGWPRLPVPVVARMNGSATYFAAEAGRRAGVPTRWIERGSARRADEWCAASAYTAERTRDVLGLRPAAGVLYNAVEIPPLAAASERSRDRVVFTGTLTTKKGVISLIDAWRRVIAAGRRAELHLFGRDDGDGNGGSMEARLRAELDERTAPTVHFRGFVRRDEIRRALETARVAVFPSYAEAFAFAPLEAMATGCPTIYSRRGSGAELIEHGRDGLLVDPDDHDGIAEAIIAVLDDDTLAARLGANGRKTVEERFSVEGLTRHSEAFYRDCIERFAGERRSA